MYPILSMTNQVVGKTNIRPPMYSGPELPDDFDITEDEYESAYYLNDEFVRKNVFSLSIYKIKKINYLSDICYQEMNRIIPPAKQMNVLLGATLGYPEYLQGEVGKQNLSKVIELFKYKFHELKNMVNDEDCDTKLKVDTILGSMVLPSLETILPMITGVQS